MEGKEIIQFKIVTPDGIFYQDDIFQVTAPAKNGEVTILPRHNPLISVLKAGELIISDKEGRHPMAVSGGFLEVRPGSTVIILADNVERAEEIDIERAEQARKRAETLLLEAAQAEDVDYAKLQAVLERELNRISVGRKYKGFKLD